MVAARLAEAEFIETAISMVFLLNKKYRPFYKWMHRAMKSLPILGEVLYKIIYEIVTIQEVEKGDTLFEKKNRLIEEACSYVIDGLKKQKLSNSSSDFLLDHGPLVQNMIQDNTIRNINVWLE